MSGNSTALVSPASAFASTAFTDAEKADIRRFCGYPTYGGTAASFQSWRFFTQYGLLEYRMSNLAPAEYQNVRYYLSLIYPIEAAVPTTSDNLDTAQAAVWTHNVNELKDRAALLTYWSKRLCNVVGVPPGPDLSGGGNIRLIV